MPASAVWAAGFLGAVLAFVVGDVLGVRRRHVVDSMRRSGVDNPVAAARRMYRCLGTGLFELIAMRLFPRRVLSTVDVPESILRPGARGAVVATAHTGNWDVAACAVAAKTPLTVITKHFSVGWLDRLWQATRRRQGLRLARSGAAARAALAALSRRELVAMIFDQRPERTRAVTRAEFLGREVDIDLSPALIAMRARVPLLVVFPVRLADGRLSLTFAEVLEPPARPSRAWAAGAMTRATEALDRFVRRNPEQWLWMHRRWGASELPVADGLLPVARGGGIRAE